MSTQGQALATARRAKGLTQEQLSERSGISQEAISRYEGDRRTPNGEAIERLADALDVTPAFLKSFEKVSGAWAIDAHLRRRATAPARVWRRLEAELNMLRNHARFLYEEIDVRAQHVMPTFDPVFTDAADAARMTRMQWRLPIGPVQALMGWAESAGCIIVERDFGTERVDGLSQWVDDHPVVLLNVTAPTDRKRLTLAHELGHLILHTVDVGHDVEQEAQRFAAEFLMPAEVIRPQLRNVTLGKLIELKRVWGVSMQALIERGYELKTLAPERRTYLYKRLSAQGWRKEEPGSLDLTPEHPQLSVQIGTALADRGLSAGEIATMTGYAKVTSDNPFLPPDRRPFSLVPT